MFLCLFNEKYYNRVLDEGPGLAIELQWSRPTQPYGELQGYRIVYAAKELNILGEVLKPAHAYSHIFQDLGMFTVYSTAS